MNVPVAPEDPSPRPPAGAPLPAGNPSLDSQGSRPGLVLAIVSIGVLLSSLDLFIVNVALPDMAADFGGADIAGLSWVLNAYAIVFAALLVPAGRLGDRSGTPNAFLLGLALFVLGSALCATAWDVGSLVAFRVIQAIGGAILTPTSLGLVLAATPAERRPTAVRLWVAFGGLGAALGPVLGGVLVEFGWRWVFLVNVPIGVIALIAGVRKLPKPAGGGGRFPDLVGALLLAAGIGAFVLALVQGADWGWSSTGTLGAFAVAVLAGTGFVFSSARHPSPVVDPELLRIPNFALMVTNGILFNMAFGAMLLSFVLWSQEVWDWSALRSGLAVAPGPLVVPIVAILAGKLIARIGPGPVIALGGTAFAAGLLWWATALTLEPNYAAGGLGGMLLTGLGVGLTLPTSFATGTGALPPHRFATGSAVLSMSRQIGLAIGVALFVLVLGSAADPQTTLDAFQRGWYVIAGVAFLAGLVGLAARLPRPVDAKPAPAQQAKLRKTRRD
ncbi:MFS transporter [Nocardia sp. XZ_19_385]|uniref:MFS transporter n=1 Tax=Nocardia sp. XZ_19_385 TaxID=2769488 RepID=UPI00188FC126|nr:MFS transporter [Nocardia sp. XZ_19_385]